MNLKLKKILLYMLCIVILIISLLFTKIVINSNLPMWLKYWLLMGKIIIYVKNRI